MDRTGWTLEYVDSLSEMTTMELIEVWQNGDKAHADNQKRALKHKGGR